MTTDYLRETYENLSSKASEISRQMGFAGIALVWLFKSGTATAPILDQQLLRATFLIILALTCDLMHYLVGAAIWFGYFRYKEKQGVNSADSFTAPTWLAFVTWVIFVGKVLLMSIAYFCFLLPFLFKKFVA